MHAVKNRLMHKNLHLISKFPPPDDNPPTPYQPRLGVPMRLAAAATPPDTEVKTDPTPPEMPPVITREQFRRSFWVFCFRWYSHKVMKILGITLVVILFLEFCLGLWLAQMSPDQFHKLTACLDAGRSVSLKKQIAYQAACFWGSFML